MLLTGRLPQRLHYYIAGVLRWAARVQAYVLSLTDAYPPFRFAGHAGPASRRSYLLASAAGSILTTAAWSAFATLVAFGGEQIEAEVPYDALVAGELRSAGVQTEVHVARVWLTLATDPLLSLEPYFVAEPGTRLIAFELTINQRPSSTENVPIRSSSYSLRSETGARYKALMVTVDSKSAPVDLGHNERAITRVIFEVPVDERPVEFRYDVLNYIDVPRVGETILYHLQ